MYSRLSFRSGRPSHAPAPEPDRQDEKAPIPCRFHAIGRCLQGNRCKFSHDGHIGRGTPPNPPDTGQIHSDSRSQIPCHFFAKGTCRNGDQCLFAHAVVAEPLAEERLQHDSPQKTQTQDNWIRVIAGAVVHFTDGATISKVSLPSDFSAVRLNKLPLDSTPSSVVDLLAKLDIDIPIGSVRIAPQTDSTHCSADVGVEDPLFAKTLCSRLRDRRISPRFEAIPIAVSMPQGSSLRRVDCRKVHASWHKPTRTVWLNFGFEEIAQKVFEKFAAGVYRVLGRRVQARVQTRERNSYNTVAWRLMLTDVPGLATEKDVCHDIPQSRQPRHTELGDPSYTVDVDHSSAIIRSMLLQVGPLEWWEVSYSEGKRAKAQARFVEESDARLAVAELDNKLLSFSDTTKLTMRLVTAAKFKVSAKIYNAVQQQIDAYRPAWRDKHLSFTVYPPLRGYQVVKVEGEDSQLVGQAKQILEQITAGEVVKDGDEVIWSSGFRKGGGHWEKIKQIERDLGVVIGRDGLKSQLRVYGSKRKCQQAIKLLIHLAKEDSSQVYSIALSHQQFRWGCLGGFKAVSTRLGVAKATFDIASTPKRIIITGSEADYMSALAIISAQRLGPEPIPIVGAGTDKTCAVCWTDAEDPVRTKCGHVYCAACFGDFCQSGVSVPAAEFRIRCVGDGDQCGTILGLEELQELLSSATFEDILEDSFASFVRRHPTEFRYCPTPDCSQIYRAVRAAAANTSGPPVGIYTCTNCLASTCMACHSLHPGMTCAEHKDIVSGGHEANQKLKLELKIQDCPKCGTSIEKTEGCNHVICGGCKVHMCWECLATFAESGPCYTHMNEKHGGIGLNVGLHD